MHGKNFHSGRTPRECFYGETLTFYLFTAKSYCIVVHYLILPKADQNFLGQTVSLSTVFGDNYVEFHEDPVYSIYGPV